ncbi:hypothetical protein CYMTET_27097 [Cymbomonas tetramitiformis]|uniref:AMP-dependent synthetase/ligase domain-containing protein n=1 Tax=Cymbomonas tetramitiformis TaxID=36881 RepID=A0AAE0KXB3_9CHLO|nr:hypothetical protein CYMTET_27097 [Cymbomonas tetramitiformis]
MSIPAISLILFTSGSTSTPKAAVHSNRGLLAAVQNKRAAFQDTLPAALSGELSILSGLPYFHVMGFVLDLLFSLHCSIRTFQFTRPGTHPTAEILLEMCNAVGPSIIETVPLILYDIADLLSRGGVSVCSQYGQTELGGMVLMGQPHGHMRAMALLPGMSYRLMDPAGRNVAGTGYGEGELVVLNCRSVFHGYAGSHGQLGMLSSAAENEVAPPPHVALRTRDVFREVVLDSEAHAVTIRGEPLRQTKQCYMTG